jgi:hypothetical protein
LRNIESLPLFKTILCIKFYGLKYYTLCSIHIILCLGHCALCNTAENVCACVNITEICLANVVSSVAKMSKTQNGSDFDVLPSLWKCKRNNECDNLKTRNKYSLHVQEVVLCKKMNQRWLSTNLLYKTFFNWTIQRYFSYVHMTHVFLNNCFFCVACIIFALTIFKGNDLLYNLIVCKCLTIL